MRLFSLILALLVGSLAQASSVSNAPVVILPGAYRQPLAQPWVSTNIVPAQGALYRVAGAIRQYTVDGWQPVLRESKFFIVYRVSGTGTVVIRDDHGPLIILDDTIAAASWSGDDIPQSPIWAVNTNGTAVLFYSQR